MPLLVALLLFLGFQLDVVITKDGNRLVGKIVKETEEKVVVRIHGGEVEISKERIFKIIREGTLPSEIEKPYEEPLRPPVEKIKEPDRETNKKTDEKPNKKPNKEEPARVEHPLSEKEKKDEYIHRNAKLGSIEFEWNQPDSYETAVEEEYVRILSEEDNITVDIFILPLPDKGLKQAIKEYLELLKEMGYDGEIERAVEDNGVVEIDDVVEREKKKSFLSLRMMELGGKILVVLARSGVENRQKERVRKIVETVRIKDEERSR